LFDDPGGVLALEPGRICGLVGPPGSGLTRVGLALLAGPARFGPVAVLDARGWFSPAAAWEAGVPAARLIIVRCADPVLWAQTAAALVEGMQALYAEVPPRVKDPLLRKLGALARSRQTPVVLRPLQGDLPAGVSHLRLETERVEWEGPDAGHGRLARRRLVLRASGKAAGGMVRVIEVEDDGSDALRVVPGLAVAATGGAAG
jgi:hypothetical protein